MTDWQRTPACTERNRTRREEEKGKEGYRRKSGRIGRREGGGE